jgi:predicted nucleic acid-binding protein
MQKEDGNSAVIYKIRQFNPDDVYISAIVIGEVTKGICLLPQGRKRRGLDIWLQGIIDRFEDRILPIDQDVAIYWGRHHAERQSAGGNVPVLDGLIAATANLHGLHVATRNVRDFKAAGAKVFNPWV